MLPKIAIFTHSVNIKDGPFPHIATALSRGLQELGVSCDVVVLNASDEDKARFPDVTVISLNAKRALFAFIPLIHYMRSQKPNVIFFKPRMLHGLLSSLLHISYINRIRNNYFRNASLNFNLIY